MSNPNHDPKTGEFTSGGGHSGGANRGTPSSTAEVARSHASTLLNQVVDKARMSEFGGARVVAEGVANTGLGVGLTRVRGGMRSSHSHGRLEYVVGGKSKSREAWLDAASQLIASGRKPTVR